MQPPLPSATRPLGHTQPEMHCVLVYSAKQQCIQRVTPQIGLAYIRERIILPRTSKSPLTHSVSSVSQVFWHSDPVVPDLASEQLKKTIGALHSDDGGRRKGEKGTSFLTFSKPASFIKKGYERFCTHLFQVLCSQVSRRDIDCGAQERRLKMAQREKKCVFVKVPDSVSVFKSKDNKLIPDHTSPLSRIHRSHLDCVQITWQQAVWNSIFFFFLNSFGFISRYCLGKKAFSAVFCSLSVKIPSNSDKTGARAAFMLISSCCFLVWS